MFAKKKAGGECAPTSPVVNKPQSTKAILPEPSAKIKKRRRKTKCSAGGRDRIGFPVLVGIVAARGAGGLPRAVRS